MRWIWIKACFVAAIAVVATQTLSFSIRYMLGRPADHITLVIAFILPILITLPIAIFVFRQTEKLNRTHAALVVAHEALARKASRDDMTGVLNRESFLSQVNVFRLAPDGGALLIVDVDHFKRINDEFGHPVGDQALMRIAGSLKDSVREGDLLGRIGGEEFAVFVVGADLPEALRVGQRLRRGVEEIEFGVLSGAKVELTVSVGGAIADRQPSLAELMRQADSCLYEAKRGGRNRVVIERALTVAA